MSFDESKLKNLKEMSLEETKALVVEMVSLIQKLKLEVKKATRYGLNWDQTTAPDEVLQIVKDKFPLLKHKSDKLIGEGKNLLIEGDNLLVLVWLSVMMPSKLDFFLIDPPYNTGKGFRYTDIFGNIQDVTEDDPYKGTKWLNMMCPRLILALSCLKDTGVCFVHIDEHSRADLELLGKMIFPKYVGETIWDKRSQKGGANAISTSHEHILIFGNSQFEEFELIEKPSYQVMMKKMNELVNLEGKETIPEQILKGISRLHGINKKEADTKFPNLKVKYTKEIIQKEFELWLQENNIPSGEAAYKFIDFTKKDLYRGTSLSWPQANNDGYRYEVKHPITKKNVIIPPKGWLIPEYTFKDWDEKGMILYGIDHTRQPEKKVYLSSNSKEKIKSVITLSKGGVSNLKELGFTGNEFEYSKPVELEKYFIQAVHKNAIGCDFFAGSGTFGQAMIEMNYEDGGERSFILVTNNENKICEEVTYERIKRVMNGTDKYEAKPDKGLAYFTLQLVSRHKNSEQFKYDLSVHIIDSLKALEKVYVERKNVEEDIVLESNSKMVIWQVGLDLNPIEKLIKDSHKEVVLYLNDFEYSDLTEEAQKKVSRVEIGILTKIAKSDFTKIM